MNSIYIAIFALSAFSLAYRFYGRFLAERVFESEGPEAEAFETPAHAQRDDIDYVPTKAPILFGHHFTSIAGAGPIVGPAIAVIWGWLPAVLWIVFGAVFIGAVHDFGCLVVSTRGRGRSMAEISGDEVNGRVRFLFLMLILFLTWIVLAVFAFVIASLFVDYPASVIPINFEIIVALILGWGVHKRAWPILWPSIAALVLLYASIFVGVQLPVVTHSLFLNQDDQAKVAQFQEQHRSMAQAEGKAVQDFRRVKKCIRWIKKHQPAETALLGRLGQARIRAVTVWMYALLAYSFVACALPVWVLLQPRDFINSHQLMLALGGLYLGLMVLHPPVVAPAFEPNPEGAPSWFPFLFVTIACGAISGFHGLVSSGTSSKQLDRLPDARPVGYRAMLGEASLGLIVTLACVAGFKSEAAWHAHYRSWAAAGPLDRKLDAFLHGGAWFLSSLGLPEALGVVIIAVIVISFAATTLDSAARIQRFVLGELGDRFEDFAKDREGGIAKMTSGLAKLFQNTFVGAFIACASPLLLLQAKTASGKPLWTAIWPIFGSANQLLGALCLVVLTIWLVRRQKNFWITAIPCAFIGLMTAFAFSVKIYGFWTAARQSGFENGKLVLAVTLLLFGFGLWILIEALFALVKLRRSPKT